jgi:glyoxylase I family protein
LLCFLIPHRDKAPTTPQDAFDHHFAIKAASFGDLIAIKNRFEERKYPTCVINRGFCYSLYVRDPNNMMVAWKNGDFSANQDEDPTVEYPLPTSTIEEMARVMPAGSKSSM